MPGIIVGVDGSGHSQRALEWAMKEAAIRHQPLTVLTVHNAVAGDNGGVAVYSDDPARTRGRAARRAQQETDKVLAGLAGPRPDSVTVKAVHGFPTDELINAGKDADMIVLGSRGAGGFARLLIEIGRQPGQPARVLPGAHRSRGRSELTVVTIRPVAPPYEAVSFLARDVALRGESDVNWQRRPG